MLVAATIPQPTTVTSVLTTAVLTTVSAALLDPPPLVPNVSELTSSTLDPVSKDVPSMDVLLATQMVLVLPAPTEVL